MEVKFPYPTTLSLQYNCMKDYLLIILWNESITTDTNKQSLEVEGCTCVDIEVYLECRTSVLFKIIYAELAQLVEQLPCKEKVICSNRIFSTKQ